PTEVLIRRLKGRRSDPELAALEPDPDYLRELNEAYHHFFFHYDATPLLVVETSELDANASEEALEDLVRQIRTAGPGTRYYVPRTKQQAARAWWGSRRPPSRSPRRRKSRPAASPRASGPS